ncbi:hypothetical protein QJQ58_09590 [Paenibacillus dendritiformis]|uniref:hypothetical protein n=1 Tax=Paenibacillus dendritiformis TaxID=130049 RepID=UPI00248D329C|nr:hypothetical protein [Paenibacillus dendritiformis]WGU96458.1 hypothetical protein QJQ58_09590 [Paenibacillus dendritiformis]
MEDVNYIHIGKFDSEDILSKWIIGLAIVHNDLLTIKRKLQSTRRYFDVQLQEYPSVIRLLASSLREAIFFLEESNKTADITKYLNDLPRQGKLKYEILRSLFRDGKNSDLLQRLTNIRNITFHYSKPKRDELTVAIESLKDSSFLLQNERDMFVFAEAVSNTLMVQALFTMEEINLEDKENTKNIVYKINEAFDCYIEFSREVVKTYIKQNNSF